jgi:putative ABC transport system permease protein
MSWWSRLANLARGDRLTREIDEELASHIDEAIAHGRDPAEARRAFGSPLRHREGSRDIRLGTWLESLRADAIFGWRQIRKNAVMSTAAILSLALAIGACTSAFRIIDALLLRPLPVAEPERLYSIAREGIDPVGRAGRSEECEYPFFRQMRLVADHDADLLALSHADRTDVTFGSDQEMEKAYLQYVSGSMFTVFGLRPTLGRLLTDDEDRTPGAHPYAVLSYDYWTRRFGQDPRVIGRTFRFGTTLYEIIGVGPERFTGTETGTVTSIFVPAMMHPWVGRSDATWFQVLAKVKPETAIEPLRQRLHAALHAFQAERAKGKGFIGLPKPSLDNFLNQKLVIDPAPTGVSGMQRSYRRALTALGVLVALVLLIACANVANLMTAQAASRAREMALRVSIGAGRWRLVQLVLVESVWLGGLAAAIGALFAWWSAPFVVGRINPPDNPARLALPLDWRLVAFGLALTFAATCLFGLAPALRASAVRPLFALRGGADPHARRRLMHVLVAVQVAFCVLVLFIASLFVTTFNRLAHQPTGFSAERLLVLYTVTPTPQPAVLWEQVADHLRTVPGVEAVSLSDRSLLDGWSHNNFLSINGGPPTETLAYFRSVSPGWMSVMKIPFVDGRDFRPGDTSPGVAIVNETFARSYFNGENPIGKSFETTYRSQRFQIVGVVRDARYRSMRDPILPTAFIPFQAIDAAGTIQPQREGALIVRTAGADPLALASVLRQEVPRAQPEFRVSNLRAQQEMNESQTVRERLMAMLALFFAGVALLLAGVGLYGVLHYSVLQRRREIGIRIALGAPAATVARGVTVDVFAMVIAGLLAGLALGLTSQRYMDTLLYQVKPSDPAMLVLPTLTILAAALLAAVPPVIHAVRINPVKMLRAE